MNQSAMGRRVSNQGSGTEIFREFFLVAPPHTHVCTCKEGGRKEGRGKINAVVAYECSLQGCPYPTGHRASASPHQRELSPSSVLTTAQMTLM